MRLVSSNASMPCKADPYHTATNNNVNYSNNNNKMTNILHIVNYMIDKLNRRSLYVSSTFVLAAFSLENAVVWLL
jgi:hypothetical protein